MASDILLVNTASGNDLLPGGTKPLPEPLLTYHQWDFVAITKDQFHKNHTTEISIHEFQKYTSKITSTSPRMN